MAEVATDGADHFLKKFSDPAAIARYEDGPKRFVPGLDALHRMTGLLLAEQAPPDARVLVLGAGGGSNSRPWRWPIRAGVSSGSIRPSRCWIWRRAFWGRS